jgi:hypothetical protein
VYKEETIMTIKNYVDAIVEVMGNEATSKDVVKNNGVVYHGVAVKSGNVATVVYVDEMYREGRLSPREAAEEIRKIYDNSRLEADVAKSFADWSATKEDVTFRVVNAQRNADLLREVPHRMLTESLAIIYVVDVPKCSGYVKIKNDHSSGYVIIKNDHMKYWGVRETDLYEAALQYKQEYEIMDVLALTMIGMKKIVSPEDMKPEGMYALSTPSQKYGASVLARESVLKNIAEKAGTNLTLIPSSIHEVIVLPIEADSERIKELTAFIREVNSTTVSEEDYLGDRPFVYSLETGLKELA